MDKKAKKKKKLATVWNPREKNKKRYGKKKKIWKEKKKMSGCLIRKLLSTEKNKKNKKLEKKKKPKKEKDALVGASEG